GSPRRPRPPSRGSTRPRLDRVRSRRRAGRARARAAPLERVPYRARAARRRGEDRASSRAQPTARPRTAFADARDATVTTPGRHHQRGGTDDMSGAVREWVTFPDPKDEGRTWQIDVTFLLSNWTCIFGRGCQGVLTERAPELVLGCCSYGAHFSDKQDRDH